MLVNPCRSCSHIDEDKNSQVCQACEDRLAYIKTIGPAGLPVSDEVFFRRKKMEPEKQSAQARENLNDSPKQIKCSGCQKFLPATSEFFNKNRTNVHRGGFDWVCKICKTNPESPYCQSKKRKGGDLPPKIRFLKTKEDLREAPEVIEHSTMVDIQPFIDKRNYHLLEFKKINKFLNIIEEFTGAKLPLSEELEAGI